jgi:prephenate dehydratase
VLPIHHCIAALSKETKPKIILSHPQALAQCKTYLSKNFPKAKLIKTLSTSEAFKKISEERLTNAAAIGSLSAAENYGLQVIDEKIEDEKNNKTKFFIISNERVVSPKADKTFIVVLPSTEKQGILYNMMVYFNNERINLTKIESRPSRKRLGNYLFYIELDGNSESKKVKTVLNNIRKNIGVVEILGSYEQEEV